MVFLVLLEALFAITVIWFLVTQVAMPALRGGKLFPLFRVSPLREKVEVTKELVNDLQDQNDCLATLAVLTKLQKELEAQILANEPKQESSQTESSKPVDQTTQQTNGVK